jgi:hypothetical protein
MQKDERDLLEVLKFELEFLEKGGYGHSPREAWRPQYIFEDSPTCMNYDCKESPDPCSDCVLMQLVPPELRGEKIPCRHIPLNELGENLDSLYRFDEQHEVEEKVGNWLRATIARLEEARRVAQREAMQHGASIVAAAIKGTPLFEKLHPKCANPACATAFHWLGGGKFFRFRADAAQRESDSSDAAAIPAHNLHGVKHFWLCERCSHIFTLAYENESGVVLTLLWPELPVTEIHTELPAPYHN